MILTLAQQIEIEFKNMLSEKEFLRLIEAFQLKEDSLVTQLNYYFDTPDFLLKSHHAALRIREKEKRFELTLKEPLDEGLLETTELLDNETALNFIHQNGRFPPGEVLNQLQKYLLDIRNIQCFGFLRTDRVELDYEGGVLVLDKSSYFQKVDYELEYEVTDYQAGKVIFRELLDSYNIPSRPAENKIMRFYKESLRVRREDSGNTSC